MNTKSKRPMLAILAALAFVCIAVTLVMAAGCDETEPGGGPSGDEKSIEMLILASDKTAYKVGDTLDTGTVEIMAIWSDGDISYIEPEDGKFEFSNGDSETLTFTERGKVTVTFVYGELTSYEMFVYVGDPYKFEAENAELSAGDRYPKVASETDGVIQVGDFSGNWKATALFRITAKEASNVMLTARVDACNPDEIEKPFTDLFYVNVNGKAFPSGAKVAANDGWGSFDSYDIGTIKLREGENTVEFVAHEAQAGNIDYIELVSAVELAWHTGSDFGTLQVDDVELEANGSAPITRTFSDARFTNAVLDFEFDGAETSVVTSEPNTPYIRTIANEYIEITVKAGKTASAGGTSVTYSVKGLKAGTVTVTAKTPQHSEAFTVTVEEPVLTRETYKFEAENAELIGAAKYPSVNAEANGIIQVGGLDSNIGSAILFRINAEKADSAAVLRANVDCEYQDWAKLFTDRFTVTVNGVEISSSAAIEVGDGWGTFVKFDLGTIALRKGENEVKFALKAACGANFDGVEIDSRDALAWHTGSDFGMLQVDDVELETGASTPITRTFSDERFKNSVLDFEFDGATADAVTSNESYKYIRVIKNDTIEITISANAGGVIYSVRGLKSGSVTVTAKTPQHSETFTVKVEEPVLTRETYKFEAENAELATVANKYPIVVAEQNGIIQVGGLDSNIGSTILFRVNASRADSSAVLRANVDFNYESWATTSFIGRFTVTVNGVEISSPAAIETTDGWGSFVKFDLGTIALKKGENEVIFVLKEACGANFDCIEIDSTGTVDWQTGDFGTLDVPDANITVGGTSAIARTFSDARFTNSVLDFEFDGATEDAVTSDATYKYIRVIKNDTIEITVSANAGGVNYSVRGLKAGTVTVTAKTPQHSKTFTITVTEGA